MELNSAWGVRIVGQDKNLLQEYDLLLHSLKKTKVKGMDLDLTELKEIVVFESIEEYEELINRKVDSNFGDIVGIYENYISKIYIYNCNFKDLPITQRKITLLHEISHFHRDKNNIFSYRQYCEDAVYRIYEELRVDILACHIARTILDQSELEYVSYYQQRRQLYTRQVIDFIKTFRSHLMVQHQRRNHPELCEPSFNRNTNTFTFNF